MKINDVQIDENKKSHTGYQGDCFFNMCMLTALSVNNRRQRVREF